MKPASIHPVYKKVKEHYSHHRTPVVELVEAQTKDPFKILVTTILSARTKDQTTAAAIKKLFSRLDSPADLEKLTEKEIDDLIFPVGFHKNKARFLKQLPGALRDHFDGIIPDTVEELCMLPGVGRKTANLVVAVAFNKPAICVDVHVHRICNRLGYVRTKTPFDTEMALREILPRRYWITFNSYLVSFGQHLCFPVNPRCDHCPVFRWCDRVEVSTKFPPAPAHRATNRSRD